MTSTDRLLHQAIAEALSEKDWETLIDLIRLTRLRTVRVHGFIDQQLTGWLDQVETKILVGMSEDRERGIPFASNDSFAKVLERVSSDHRELLAR